MSIFNPEQWAKDHFQHANLGDPRRTERLVDISAAMASHSGKSMAVSCKGDDAALEGAYRFIRNDNVSADVMRAAGFAHTALLAKETPEILALEDTTSLSYKHQVAESLGKLGKKTDKSRGWWVHSTLLLDSKTTRTLGLIHQDWWCRPDDISDADEKESGKWPDASYFCRQRLGDTMANVISVCDREADILNYIVDKQSHRERFVVRAKHPRKIEESELTLFDYLDTQAVIGGYSLDIPQKGLKKPNGQRVNRPSRQAQLSVKVASITLKGKVTTQSINVVLAQETNTAAESEPLRWVLLTTEPVDTLANTLKIINIYAARWRVEDFHKAWKTGAGAERQRMTEADNLERAVSILAFVGVRLLQLREALTLPFYLRKQGLQEEATAVESESCGAVPPVSGLLSSLKIIQ
ncbi:IS4 family transposase [Shewanella psychromarinicola]|uniref:IS4 family transposase n=1 Tax=Shewanella psychromarinicola TaxID=2487742 RepID=A0A3N4DZ73_9GAMM|nr:IS4 family transposase [Shewanella psychromarinicola]RPA31203.1 IS4 family transposase [Shewanella psychromarinicola]